MTAVIDALTLRPGGMLFIGNKGSDKVEEIPTFTCKHCNRCVIKHPLRTRARHTCKHCMGYICDLCARLPGCYLFEADAERAHLNLANQPWLLRHWGEPVDRIWQPDGQELLVLRKDHNMTLIERTKYRRS